MEFSFVFRTVVLTVALVIPCNLYAQESAEQFDQLLAQTKSTNSDEQVAAFLKLANYPDKVDQLLIPMVEAMIGTDTRVGEAAQFAAQQMGEAMAKYCDTQLEAESQKQVAAAAEMIYRLGDIGIASTPKLVALTKSDDPKRRLSGLWGLVYLKNSDPSVVDAIEPFLDDPDFRNQVVACRAIVTIGPPAVRLATKLKSLVETGNVSTRSHALIALGAIGPNPDFDVVELLGKHLDVFLQPERDRALIGISYLGKNAMALREKVEGLLNDVDKNVQPQAALALWKMTGDSQRSLKALVAMSQTVNLEYEALNAIYQMGSEAAPAVDDIAKHLENADSAMRAVAVEILENLGPVAAPHRESLEQLAKNDSDPLVRFYCERALKKLDAGK